MQVSREAFDRLVAHALDSLPREFQTTMQNVEIVVEYRPTLAQLRRAGLPRWRTLLGLYEGVPRTQRTSHYGLVLPDKITVFQEPIEALCHTEEEIRATIHQVVLHEIAHHFGSSEETLRQIEHRQR